MSPELRSQFPCPLPGCQQYAAAVASEVAAAFPGADGPELILEPGAAITTDTMRFVAEGRSPASASARARSPWSRAAFTTSSRPCTTSSCRCGWSAPHGERAEQAAGVPVDVVGYTCMEHDCLYRDCKEAMRPGDFASVRERGRLHRR